MSSIINEKMIPIRSPGFSKVTIFPQKIEQKYEKGKSRRKICSKTKQANREICLALAAENTAVISSTIDDRRIPNGPSQFSHIYHIPGKIELWKLKIELNIRKEKNYKNIFVDETSEQETDILNGSPEFFRISHVRVNKN